MLRRQFASSARLLVETLDLTPPLRSRHDPHAVSAIVIAGVAASAVGQLAAWVALDPPRDRGLIMELNALLLPEWWTRPD
ncbi:hypothetical protein GCM10009808_09820 [Microbacterium sediminicola]|uniref:MftR C-terminal domain-containing protein n=1 Tax=Microbacterium sediminicola TaxID=415210 RepID=A0ABP4TWA3_9MICO